MPLARPARTRIKVCGVRDPDTARAAADAGADAIGLVFVESSPRFIEPEDAFAVMSALPPLVASVGVFMDHSVDDFLDIEQVCPTLYSQLHGDEDPKTVKACGPDVIKAVRVDPDRPEQLPELLAKWAALEEVAAILVDAPAPGAGRPFDWKVLAPHVASVHVPIFLAGGLTPENVGDAIRTVRPYAVDVSSGVERDRGVKDPRLIERFCDAVREADRG